VTTVVFVGPTLPSEQVRRTLPNAVLRSPAACGDLYRATKEGATSIVLIDGYFDQQLAVWHKEVLWALSRGVRVYGAASMGALRAAELQRFGMIGVGRIFDWYASGVIEADDEVAVAHESEERGYRVVSEAMVNLRATFLAAESAAVIRADTVAALVEIGRSSFYPSRSLKEVLRCAERAGVDAAELEALGHWLRSSPKHIVDQKRADALAALERVRADLAQPEAIPATPQFSFSYTEVWHELTRRVAADTGHARSAPLQLERTPTSDAPSGLAAAWTERVMEFLATRAPAVAGKLRREAERRGALLGCATHSSLEADPGAVQATANELRRQRQLLTTEQTQVWLSERGLGIAEFSQWMGEDTLIAKALELAAPASEAQLRRAIHESTDPAVLEAIADVNEALQAPRIAATGGLGMY